MGIESVSLQTKFGILLFAALMPLIAAYSWYIYRVTVPPVSRAKRIFLFCLRAAAVMLALFIAAEPVITLTKKNILRPVHAVFVDNSKSMSIQSEQYPKAQAAMRFLEELKGHNSGAEYHLYTFGKNTVRNGLDSIGKLRFTEPVTNFNHVFNEIRKNEPELTSITFVTDGIVTEGDDPTNAAEKPGAPIFMIAVGDTNQIRDIVLQDLAFNDNIVAGIQTPIRVNIISHNYDNTSAALKVFEDNTLIDEKTINLRSGVNQVVLNYLPKSAGEKKIVAQIEPVAGETNKENNRKASFVKVLDSKVKVLLIAGMPSADFSFIKEALKSDTNLIVRDIVEIGPNKTLVPYSEKLLDSASVYFLIDYPAVTSSQYLFQQAAARIRDNHKPFFMLIDENVSYQMLGLLTDQMPIRIRPTVPGSFPVQPVLVQSAAKHPIVQVQGSDIYQAWSNLPPVMRLNCDAASKPEAENLLTLKTGNNILSMPLMSVRGIGRQRSAVLLAKDIWRWQLLSRENKSMFPSFMLNVFRWLNSGGERERLNVFLPKKIYAAGERVDFTAELYDESFNVLSDERLEINVRSGSEKWDISMNSLPNGIYQSSFDPQKPGDYSYTATYKEKDKKVISKSGRFLVGGQEIELQNLTTDIGMLRYMSGITGGKVFYGPKYSGLFNEYSKLNSRRPAEKITSSEINIWNNLWVLGIVILVFSAEWFLRKRAGML